MATDRVQKKRKDAEAQRRKEAQTRKRSSRARALPSSPLTRISFCYLETNEYAGLWNLELRVRDLKTLDVV